MKLLDQPLQHAKSVHLYVYHIYRQKYVRMRLEGPISRILVAVEPEPRLRATTRSLDAGQRSSLGPARTRLHVLFRASYNKRSLISAGYGVSSTLAANHRLMRMAACSVPHRNDQPARYSQQTCAIATDNLWADTTVQFKHTIAVWIANHTVRGRWCGVPAVTSIGRSGRSLVLISSGIRTVR